MDQKLIFAPFLSMILWTLLVWAYMYAKRIPFIRSNKLGAEQLTPFEFARISPPEVSNPSDNLKNLFEVPTLFYAMLLYLYVTNQVDIVHVAASWIFVAFRVLHSAVHCTINLVMVRFLLYCVSTLALWVIAVRAALHAFA
jgi:hypothetical protein